MNSRQGISVGDLVLASDREFGDIFGMITKITKQYTAGEPAIYDIMWFGPGTGRLPTDLYLHSYVFKWRERFISEDL